jgi:transposase
MKLICQTAYKNDKIDSRKIMELLARNYLPTSYQATPAERHLRERIRWRASSVRKVTAIKNSIKAVLAKENISIKNPYSTKARLQLVNAKMSEVHRELLSDMFTALDTNEDVVERQNQWILQNATMDSRIALLKSIPGIGEVSAVAFLAEVGNVERFQNPSQLASYFGLVPRLSESADKRRQGGITKEGSSMLRWLLVQDAWTAITKSREFRRRFLSISRRRGKQVAIVSIARKLAEVAFCVLRDRTPFCESKLSKTE